jgi:hypothetical protein
VKPVVGSAERDKNSPSLRIGAERKHPRAMLLVPVLVGLLGAFVYHRYSILTGLDRVQADPGDSRFVAFLLEHWNNVLHGRADWLSPPIFWPVRGTLAYSDGLVGMGIVHAALRARLGVFPAMNAQLILLSIATFAAAYALFSRGFGLSVLAATLGAYFFAFSWPRFAQLVHVQLQFTALLPLLLLLALECVRDGRALTRGGFAWRILTFVALLALLLATTLYYAVFAALGFTVAGMICLANGTSRSHLVQIARRHAASLVGAAGLAALLLGPVVAFYLPLMRESGGRQWSEMLPFLPRPTNLLWMGRENWVWGWLFSRWPAPTIGARWPELRIGAGLVASCAWACAAGWSAFLLIAQRRRLDKRSASIAVAVVTGLILQILMMRLPGDASLWWAVWRLFPGAGGVRAVARLEILVTLAMGLAFGWALDRVMARGPGRRRGLLVACATALVAAGSLEQIGRVQGYSGSRAEALAREVGRDLPPTCTATYVIATPDLIPRQPMVDEAHFDPHAYLVANPDVAANWRGAPWEHYAKYGRAEQRLLDPAAASRHLALMYFAYAYTIPLAASLSGVPVVNGFSGWQPPGWHLFDVLAPNARQWLVEWLALRRVKQDAVCVVPVRLTTEMVPDLPAGMLP